MVQHPDHMIIFGAAALALFTPAFLLWPNDEEIIGAPPVLIGALAMPDVTSTGAALARPLFAASPLAETPSPATGGEELAPAPAAPPEMPLPTITGIIAHGGGGGLVLARTAAGETISLRIGERVDGWMLVMIRPTAAAFRRGGRRVTVGLDLSNKHGGSQTPIGRAGS